MSVFKSWGKKETGKNFNKSDYNEDTLGLGIKQQSDFLFERIDSRGPGAKVLRGNRINMNVFLLFI